MGHLRLGRLPKTVQWSRVVARLDEAPDDVEGVVRSTVEAADNQLRALAREDALAHCFWLLARVTLAARSEDFEAAVRDLRLTLSSDASLLGFIAQVAEEARRQQRPAPASGPFPELALLAMTRALSETVGASPRGLFDDSVGDLQRALRAYSTDRQFGVLAKGFFADFFARTLRYFVSKELSHHVGADHALGTVAESRAFTEALDTYARQSARIMEEFASGWYAKRNWERRGQITLEDARGFVAVALRKLRMELRSEAAQA